MHRFFVDEKKLDQKKEFFPSGELLHQLKNVLKLNNKEILIISEGLEYKSFFDGKKVILLEKLDNRNIERKNKIILLQSFIKNSKLSFLVQKVTELGIDKIIFIPTNRSIPKKENYLSKIDRLRKITIESSEQSNRVDFPNLIIEDKLENINFNKENSIILLAYEKEEKSNKIKKIIKKIKEFENIYLFVGPEGGFTKEELNSFKKYFNERILFVSLNKNILRSETAAISFVSTIIYELD